MADLCLSYGDPLCLTLAADCRLSQPDFVNDQIWELRLQEGEPPSLSLQTTYGLRAHWMRIFPQFTYENKTLTNPLEFPGQPQVMAVYPNLIRLLLSPFEGVNAWLEFWVPSSQVIACQMWIENDGNRKGILRVDWAALLSPRDEGKSMVLGGSLREPYLVGHTGRLVPVLMLKEAASAGATSFPTLGVDLDLAKPVSHSLTWACAAREDEESSVELARQTLSLQWEEHQARIERLNAGEMVEIRTGQEDWDAALALSQTSAFGLFLPGNQALPNPTFTLVRQPDFGYSMAGDGSDYSHLWKGQTALDALYLANLILPGGSDLIFGVIENFLAVQDEDGRVDWRPNLVGLRSRHLAQPVLASLAWKASAYHPNAVLWLSKLYPGLLRFLQAWFTPEIDKDEDSFPEWEHPLQTGLEDLPLYDPWHPTGQGVDITLLECPSLAAMLFQECQSLARIANWIGRIEALPWLEEKKTALRNALEPAWDEKSGLYRYRDYLTHQCQEGGLIKTFLGPGSFPCHRSFRGYQRIQLCLTPFEEHTRSITVKIIGQTAEGEITEEIGPRRWTWSMHMGRATCRNLFRGLIRVEVIGSQPNDLLSMHRVDHQMEDISMFLPLWSGMVDFSRARKMIDKAWLARFLMPYGPPTCRSEHEDPTLPNLSGVSPFWVQFVGEGLLRYGFRQEAADLFTRTMDGIISSLKRFHSFRETYHAEIGQPAGERNHLRGLAPVGLLLRIAGIEKLSKKEIILHDFNSLPLPITVKYHGMVIDCHSNFTEVRLPDGQSVQMKEPGLHRITFG